MHHTEPKVFIVGETRAINHGVRQLMRLIRTQVGHFNLNSLTRFLGPTYELVAHCYIEDTIRKGPEDGNILTVCFKKAI